MRSPVASLCIVPLLAIAGVCHGEGNVHRFEVDAKAVGARYTIEVVVPSAAPAGGSKYPAVYCTDWFVLSDYLKSLPRLMEMGRLTEPFILVGISQPGGTDEWATARTRDFTPARPTDEYSRRNTYPGATGLAGGALRFVAFLRDELIPQVESKYPADPARRAFLGYSLGGLLGIEVLARDPQLFGYYVIGSPSAWFNDFALARELDKGPARRLEAVKRLYLSVGEDESWEMLKGYGLVRDGLARAGLSSSRTKAEIIADSGHVGAMPISLYNGLRHLFPGK